MEKKEIFKKGYLLCFFILLSIILISTTSFSATIRVPADYQLIQTAIDAASDGDTVLVADGTYVGPGNKDLDFRGKAITVRSENGPEKSIIDCEGDGRGFYFHSSEKQDSVLSGFTITGGSNGGIRCGSSSPTIKNCIIKANYSGWKGGGGIECSYSSPTITNCKIIENKTNYYGGGILFSYGSGPTITNCLISDNTADRGGGISGNELHGSQNASITKCIITGNSANYGGGIEIFAYSYMTAGLSLTISNCIISKNIASKYGSGIYLDFTSSDENYIFTNCTISDNSSTISGGGIFVAPNPNYQDTMPGMKITNSIFWENSPDEIAPFSSEYLITYSDIQGGHEGEGNINADPQFVGNGDYHLTALSPCIDKGTAVGALGYDIDGDQRPLGAGYDIGADEYPSTKTIPKAKPWIPLLLLDD